MPTDIRTLDWSLLSPAENLACDEALLEDREAHGGPGILRFWESAHPFIVLGYAAEAAEEIYLDACRQQAIGIYRRCSGGGTVLQGPGCLNYSLVLPLDSIGPAATISQTNRFVMERHRHALISLLGSPVTVAGHTDLVLNDRKFSGNAQRRKRDWFLFHGTFLLQINLELMEQVLRLPGRQPDYRRQRTHADFIRTIPIGTADLKAALQQTWQANQTIEKSLMADLETGAIPNLVASRYGREEWNLRRAGTPQ